MSENNLLGTDLKDIFKMIVKINREYDSVYHKGMDPGSKLRDDLHHIIDEMFEFIEADTKDSIIQEIDTSDDLDMEAADIVIMSIGFFVHYITERYPRIWKDEKIIYLDDDEIATAAMNVFLQKFHEVYNRDWEAKKNGNKEGEQEK